VCDIPPRVQPRRRRVRGEPPAVGRQEAFNSAEDTAFDRGASLRCSRCGGSSAQVDDHAGPRRVAGESGFAHATARHQRQPA